MLFLVFSVLNFDPLDVVFDSLVILKSLVKTFYQILFLRSLFNVNLYLKFTVFSYVQTQLNAFFAELEEILFDSFAFYPNVDVIRYGSPLILQKLFGSFKYLLLSEINLIILYFDFALFFYILIDQ